MLPIGERLTVTTTTSPVGTRLVFALPSFAVGRAKAYLDRREVEQLREACDAFLEGRPV
jgi:hypothetical protein